MLATRRESFKVRISDGKLIRIAGAYDAISAAVIDRIRVNGREFDGLWASSLGDSLARGRPDMEVVDLTNRLQTVAAVHEVSRKPLIFDGDTGGRPEALYYMIQTLDRAGVCALVLEDKTGPKRNSNFGYQNPNMQASPDEFCEKLSLGQAARINADFQIFARIESFICGKTEVDALDRAARYLSAGADGIMIHSISRQPTEILDFCRAFRRMNYKVPLMVVPTTYSSATEDELESAGVSIVVYANQLIRSAYAAMFRAAADILNSKCAQTCDTYIESVETLLKIFPEPPDVF